MRQFFAAFRRKTVLAALALMTAASPASRVLADENWEGYPAREVERPPLPPAKGMESLFTVWSLSATRAFNDDGEVDSIEGDYNLARYNIRLAYGITDFWELCAGLPYVAGEIGETTGGSISNPYLGTRFQLSAGDSFHLALGLRYSMDFGDADYHYEILGDDMYLQNFRIADPGPGYYPTLELRYNLDRTSLRLGATGIYTGEGETYFHTVEGASNRYKADPGDGYLINAGLYFQASEKWVPGLFCEFGSLSETRVEDWELGDDMAWSSVSPRLIYQLSAEFEISARADYLFAARNMPAGLPLTLELKSRF